MDPDQRPAESALQQQLSELPLSKKKLTETDPASLRCPPVSLPSKHNLWGPMSFRSEKPKSPMLIESPQVATTPFSSSQPSPHSLQRISSLVRGIESRTPPNPGSIGPSVRNFLKPSHLGHSKTSSLIKTNRFQNQDSTSPSLVSTNSNHVDNNASVVHNSKSINNDHNNSTRKPLFLSRNHVRKNDKLFIRSDNGGKVGLKFPVRTPSSEKVEEKLSKDSDSSPMNDSSSRVEVEVISQPSQSNGASVKNHSSSTNYYHIEGGPRLIFPKNCHINRDSVAPRNHVIEKEPKSELIVPDVEEEEEENGLTASQESEESNCRSPNGRIDSSSSSVLSESGGDSDYAISTPFSSPVKDPESNLQKKPLSVDLNRRTQRKRKPTKPFVQDILSPKVKIRRHKDESDIDAVISASIDEVIFRSNEKTKDTPTDIDMITTNSISPSELSSSITTPKPRSRRGTGRPRGRPRGSTLKAKLEREAALKKDGQSSETPGETVDGVSLPAPGDPSIRGVRRRGAPRGPRKPRGSTRGNRRSTMKRKPKKEKKLTPAKVEVFEEETRMSMSADVKPGALSVSNSIDNKNDKDVVVPSTQDEDASNMSSNSASTSTVTKMKKYTKECIEERKPVTAETLYEFQWPLDDPNADYYMLQEQITEYLGLKSFRRKYPDIKRRMVDMEERDFLRSQKVVSETQVDLGLTAISSSDVLDIMFNDFHDKYVEYMRVMDERKEQELRELTKMRPATTTGSPVRDKSAEYMKRILKSCAKWNMNVNKERFTERRKIIDSQTNVVHVPSGSYKVLPPEATKVGHYPVAVLPGQYSDHYKTYTPNELNYLPLNTVRYGPVLEINENLLDSDSDSDSDSSDSSEDSSASSSFDEDEDEQEDEDVIIHGDPSVDKETVICKTCDGNVHKNREGVPEVLISCTKCGVPNHPSCLDLTLDMLPFLRKYEWQCTDCKNCIECDDPADEDKMLFCDLCDRGYHIYCVGLRKVPIGRWHCRVCASCHSCGVTYPSSEDRTAEWHHVFKRGEKNSKFYLHSLCVSCHKVYKKGQYCPNCMKCHVRMDPKNLEECLHCEKFVHKECIKRPMKHSLQFMCDVCVATEKSKTPSNTMSSSSSSKMPSSIN